MIRLNYQHLRYFYEVAKHGSIKGAAESTHLTPQTLSSQIQLLEARLGQPLFDRIGRGLKLTPAGEFAMQQAEKIFAMGDALYTAMSDHPGTLAVPLHIGLTDSVPKLMASECLQSLLGKHPDRELVVSEGSLDDLMGKLITGQLHAVLTDREPQIDTPVAIQMNSLVSSRTTIMGTKQIVDNLVGDFPQCLNHAPMVLWADNSNLHTNFFGWLNQQKLRPKVVARCADSALMKSLAAAGNGLVPVPSVIAKRTSQQLGFIAVGEIAELRTTLWCVETANRKPINISWPTVPE